MIRLSYEIDGVLSLLIPPTEVVASSRHDIHIQHVYCILLVTTAFYGVFFGGSGGGVGGIDWCSGNNEG